MARIILVFLIASVAFVTGGMNHVAKVVANHACGWHIPFPAQGSVVAGPIAPDWNPFNGLFEITNEYCGQYKAPDGNNPAPNGTTYLNAYKVGEQFCIKQDVKNLTNSTLNMNSYFDVFRITDFKDGTNALDETINRSQYQMAVQNASTGTTQAQIYYNWPVVNKNYPPGQTVTDTFCWPAGSQNDEQTDGSNICGYFQFDLFYVPTPVGDHGEDRCGIMSCATSGFIRVVGCNEPPSSSHQCQELTIFRNGTQIQQTQIQLGDEIVFRGFASATNTTVSKLKFTLTKGGVAQTPVEVAATQVGALYQADYTVNIDTATSYSVTAEAISP